MKFGAIDIGTNAARLLIGEVTRNEKSSYVSKVSYTRIPLRLGETVFEEGKIPRKKEEEFLKTMQAFKLISEIFEVKELRACATSAMREAENGKEVQKKILKKTGIPIEIISGDEEAEIIFSTFFLLKIDKKSPFIVVDVGGGSTEISLFSKGKRIAAKSFKIGTIRLLKKKTQAKIWKDIEKWLGNNIDLDSSIRVYATGGNINKAHKILGGGYMQPQSVEKLKSLKDELSALSLDERITKFQLKPDRADVIVPALEIYLFIMKIINCQEIIVPKIGLADGMIYDMHMKHN